MGPLISCTPQSLRTSDKTVPSHALDLSVIIHQVSSEYTLSVRLLSAHTALPHVVPSMNECIVSATLSLFSATAHCAQRRPNSSRCSWVYVRVCSVAPDVSLEAVGALVCVTT